MSVIEQDSNRFAKTLVGTRGKGLQPVMRTLPDVYIEGKWIAREIKRVIGLTGRMIRERDIAILVRTTSMTRTLEGALASAGLRYRMVSAVVCVD
jgi:DNA helicase II / ATP-dependent DNA helicase PcrA